MPWVSILDHALVLFGSGLLALLGVLLHRLSVYAQVKARNERVAGFVRRLEDYAMRVVKDVYMAYVDPLKKCGQWTTGTAMTARASAIAALRSHVNLKELEELFFGGDPDQVLGTFIEAAVHDNKQLGKLASDVLGPAKPPIFGPLSVDRSRPTPPSPLFPAPAKP